MLKIIALKFKSFNKCVFLIHNIISNKNYEYNFFFKCLTFSACVASGRKRALKDENTLGGIKKDAVDIKKSICFFIIN